MFYNINAVDFTILDIKGFGDRSFRPAVNLFLFYQLNGRMT